MAESVDFLFGIYFNAIKYLSVISESFRKLIPYDMIGYGSISAPFQRMNVLKLGFNGQFPKRFSMDMENLACTNPKIRRRACTFVYFTNIDALRPFSGHRYFLRCYGGLAMSTKPRMTGVST